MKFLDGEAAELDFYGLCESKSIRFSGISSFTADKQSIKYLQEYLSEHLKYKRQMDDFGEKYGEKWGGFVKELDWIEWQEHMEFLIHRMNLLLASDEEFGELLAMQYSGELLHSRKYYRQRSKKRWKRNWLSGRYQLYPDRHGQTRRIQQNIARTL